MMLYLSNQTCFLFDPDFPLCLLLKEHLRVLEKRKVTVSFEASPYVPNMFKFINKVWTETNSYRYMAKNVLYWKIKASFFYNPSLCWELNPVHLALLNYTCLSKYLITWLTFAVVFTQYNRCARATFITWKRMLDLLWVLC